MAASDSQVTASGMWQSCDNHMTYADTTIVHTCVDPWPKAQTNQHVHFPGLNGSLSMYVRICTLWDIKCNHLLMSHRPSIHTSVDWALHTLKAQTICCCNVTVITRPRHRHSCRQSFFMTRNYRLESEVLVNPIARQYAHRAFHEGAITEYIRAACTHTSI